MGKFYIPYRQLPIITPNFMEIGRRILAKVVFTCRRTGMHADTCGTVRTDNKGTCSKRATDDSVKSRISC